MLGNDFVNLAAESCGVTPLDAKVTLYYALDDAKAKYFDEIFDAADKANPTLVWKIGTPRIDYSEKCMRLAQEFLSTRNLQAPAWKEHLFVDGLSNKLATYKDGALGAKFLEEFPIGEDIHIAALRFLAEALACPAAEDYVYTEAQKHSPVYQLTTRSGNWTKLMGLTTSTVNALRGSAALFLDRLFKSNFDQKRVTGLTFGWMSEDLSEWHLFGNLISTLLFRTEKKDIPGIFGAANCEIPKKTLETLYNSTYLCYVAADRDDLADISMEEDSFWYTVPMSKIKALTWLGDLPSMVGPWAVVRKSILNGYETASKEEDSNV